MAGKVDVAVIRAALDRVTTYEELHILGANGGQTRSPEWARLLNEYAAWWFNATEFVNTEGGYLPFGNWHGGGWERDNKTRSTWEGQSARIAAELLDVAGIDPAPNNHVVSLIATWNPSSATVAAKPETKADTPPAENTWVLETGLFRFGGRVYDCGGYPLKLLAVFLNGTKLALDMKDFLREWEDGAMVTEENVRNHLSALRKVLRRVAQDHGFDREILADPIPHQSRAWRFLLPKS